ncbi:GTP-binding nuclear protein Ran, putative [Entamoeba invadens IP1]|uniref:GTP-binding nuclear protein Ran, putative n=1 Tax=Entamoeba invadens IP1 TaxID=370355 RepID=A0A0A1UE37_ENTIV|nr:GTP-binding nuclear protein Ran, putative [Entamoeba invadens IP1]ELP94752.1 GTP-binding nuclear protein Ran, putative [Entamoeba invadens IP1]|eukprot:XP_004261523.1 GTP-binding nuclear protein Ran, putative [Entamoeba invadens IP1]
MSDAEVPKVRLVCIGDFGVGKTSFIKQMTTSTFEASSTPELSEVTVYPYQLHKTHVELDFIDSLGVEETDPENHFYYQKCHGAFLLFDLHSENSFKRITQLYQSVKKYSAQFMVSVLVGTKSDLGASISDSQVTEFCTTNKLKYFPLSSLKHDGFDDCLNSLVLKIWEVYVGKDKKHCSVV